MDIRKSVVVLDPTEIPHDITFVIEECGSKVMAHKVIMAMGSPMCNKQFFGELREKKDEIVIKNTTKDAFVVMVDLIYGKEVNWASKTIEELFDIADMAEKYQVEALTEKLKEAAQKYPLHETSVVTVAAIAEKFGQYENLSNTILMRCSEFLSSILTTRDDFCGFANRYAGTKLAVVAFKLQAGMIHVKPTIKSCCMLNTCRRGKPMLEKNDFIVGEKVKINPEATDSDVTDVMRKNSAEGTIKKINGGLIHLHGDDWYSDGYYIQDEGVATFLFCKC